MSPRPEYIKPDYIGSSKLAGKKCFVTGGDSGIGRAICVHFAREGADVAFTYLSEELEDANETVNLIEKEGAKAFKVESDLARPHGPEDAFAKAKDFLGEVDVLINNAAFQNHVDSIGDLSFEQFQKTFETNVFSLFKMIKASLPYMGDPATIINTTSLLGYVGDDTLADYAATKAAIRNLTKSFAKELSDKHIRVNAVAPGPVWTPLNPAEREYEQVKEFGKGTSFGRPAQPSELAPAYVYLASEITGSFITGETINIFGSPSGAN